MSKNLVQITTQYFENGKPKGLVMFSVRAEVDHFMYAEDDCISAIKNLLLKKSNDYVKYEYISHEIIFHEIEALNDDAFEVEVKKEWEKRH